MLTEKNCIDTCITTTILNVRSHNSLSPFIKHIQTCKCIYFLLPDYYSSTVHTDDSLLPKLH